MTSTRLCIPKGSPSCLPPLSGSLKAKIKMPARLGSRLGRIHFRFIQVIGRIPFPEAVGQGLCFLGGCQHRASLSALQGLLHSFTHGPIHPQASNNIPSPSCPSDLSCQCAPSVVQLCWMLPASRSPVCHPPPYLCSPTSCRHLSESKELPRG